MSIMQSDFVKKNILECYGLMRDYFHADVESQVDFDGMYNGIDRLRIGIPEDIYAKIIKFVDEELAPLVEGHEDHDKVFAECIEAEEKEQRGEVDSSEVAAAYLRIMFSLDDKITKFGMEELYPYLV